jgi:SAM-dependent methyltransferase
VIGSEEFKFARNRAYLFTEEQQKALDENRISEDQWFENHMQFTNRHYLAADNPRAQSGHSGGEGAYRFTRGMILEAIDRSGRFLDVGCANGYLLEKLQLWLEGSEVRVDFFGLEISPEMRDLAIKRNPRWRDRIFLGNALNWVPKTGFDMVCAAELSYVPLQREKELFVNLYERCLLPGGRLILGPATERGNVWDIEKKTRSWGYKISGYCEKSHHTHPDLCKRLLWFDKKT